MYGHSSTRSPRFSLRTSHRKPVRLAVSHRDVPSAYVAPMKDRDQPMQPSQKGTRR
jgi:hypothetical protein